MPPSVVRSSLNFFNFFNTTVLDIDVNKEFMSFAIEAEALYYPILKGSEFVEHKSGLRLESRHNTV